MLITNVRLNGHTYFCNLQEWDTTFRTKRLYMYIFTYTVIYSVSNMGKVVSHLRTHPTVWHEKFTWDLIYVIGNP